MVGLSSSIKPIGSIMAIDAVNLGRIDLNLLVHLDALLAERSVTRAAARVGIGQSSMSHNLARLRELFSDELLTRGPEGLRLTPRAVTLVEPVRTALSQIQTLGVARRSVRSSNSGANFQVRAGRQHGNLDRSYSPRAPARGRARYPPATPQHRLFAAPG